MHLLAVFDMGVAAPPAGLMVAGDDGGTAVTVPTAPSPEAVECAAAAALDALAAAAGRPAVRLAPGVGFAAEGAPAVVASAGARAAMFLGTPPPASWGQEEGGGGEGAAAAPATAAERVLSLMAALSDQLEDDAAAAATAALADLADAMAAEEGQEEGAGFALVAYDAETRSLVAAKHGGPAGPPLFWGVDGAAGLLLFGADPADLGACYPTATPFPSGAVFTSRGGAGGEEPGEAGFVIVGGGHAAPGRLGSFVRRRAAAADARPPSAAGRPPRPAGFKAVRAVPRMNEQGQVCGSVFRVASEGEGLVDLARPACLA